MTQDPKRGLEEDTNRFEQRDRELSSVEGISVQGDPDEENMSEESRSASTGADGSFLGSTQDEIEEPGQETGMTEDDEAVQPPEGSFASGMRRGSGL